MVAWKAFPQRKVEAGSTDISHDVDKVEVHRPENAISRAILSVADDMWTHYVGDLDSFTVIKVSFRYGSESWTQVFEGPVEQVGPKLGDAKTVEVVAYGYGRALRNTHCVANYGSESEVPTIDTPHEIWDDLIDEMINKSFGGAATGYAITKNKVAPCANPSINFLEGGYRSNFQVINDVLMAYQGYRDGSSGMHWFVDESKNLFINTIANHENNASGWPTYWGAGASAETLVEGIDFTNAVFHKTTQNFANKIILYCNLRKPGTDIWTEDGGPTWGSVNCGGTTPEYSVTQYVVGSHSLHIQTNDAALAFAYYPSTLDAGWDLTNIGSEESIPTINFYWYRDADIAASILRLTTTDESNDYYGVQFSTFWTDPVATWVHKCIPIGSFWKTKEGERQYEFTPSGGAEDWADINGIVFGIQRVGAANGHAYVDDLHFAGKIIREAYNSTSITAYDEVQKIVRYDVAVDDALKASTDTGTAANLAYGELLTRQVIPTVGTFVTPLALDALPGQLVHLHCGEQVSGSYRVDADFRIKEIIHTVTDTGAVTTWDVTSDVLNTFVPGFNDALQAYYKLIHTDPELKNLRTTGLDPYVSRLSKDYP